MWYLQRHTVISYTLTARHFTGVVLAASHFISYTDCSVSVSQKQILHDDQRFETLLIETKS